MTNDEINRAIAERVCEEWRTGTNSWMGGALLEALALKDSGWKPEPPVDPIVLRAREICASEYEADNTPYAVRSVRSGDWDNTHTMRFVIRALREAQS